MYTRCTECRTVFHITVAELRAADGRVVCGQCDAQFDALENLTDTLPPADDGARRDTGKGGTGDEGPSASRARDEDDFLREIESLIVDDGSDPGVPTPDEVFRVDDGEHRHARVVIAEAPDWEFAEEAQAGDAAPSPGPDGRGKKKKKKAGEAPRAGEDAAASSGDDKAPVDEPEPPLLPLPDTSAGRPRRMRLLAAGLALLVVAGAWIHLERGRLLRHAAGQAILAPVYSALGVEVSPDWSPDDLKVLRSATVADPDTPGSLRVTTEFRNAAGFAQPYPVLRVTLEDRWGQKVSARDFRPSEYLETHVAGRRMSPGDRVQATVSLPDPGTAADGFRVDLCLETPDRALRCATETASP